MSSGWRSAWSDRTERLCVRCPMLWPDPHQRPRLVEIRDNLSARVSEAEGEGWPGEVEGLQISLAGAESKLAPIDGRRDLTRPSERRLQRPNAPVIGGRATIWSSENTA